MIPTLVFRLRAAARTWPFPIGVIGAGYFGLGVYYSKYPDRTMSTWNDLGYQLMIAIMLWTVHLFWAALTAVRYDHLGWVAAGVASMMAGILTIALTYLLPSIPVANEESARGFQAAVAFVFTGALIASFVCYELFHRRRE